MSEKGRSAFTLVELLVVISIIVILMSILLPALKYARSVVGQGMCAKQIRDVSQGFHAYLNEHEERIPWNSTCGNLETYEVMCGDHKRPTGFGVLYDTKLVQDHHSYYCPTGGDPAFEAGVGSRQNIIDTFEDRFAQGNSIHCDYVIGYWIMPGCGPWPLRLGTDREGDSFEALKKDRVAWMADGKEVGWWRTYHARSHQEWRMMNVGMLDGSVRAIIEYQSKLPRGLPHDIYWPNNDRPMWGWWEYFGVGKGM